MTAGVMAAALLVVGGAGFAHAAVERVPGNWEIGQHAVLTFTCTLGCSGAYEHMLHVENFDAATGEFSGSGHYAADPAVTWDITGTVTGDEIDFTIVYTGVNAGYTVTGEGTIGEDGTVTATAVSSTGQEFSLGVDTAMIRFMGNHGQYVSGQEDKRAAAHSRIGMPVHSHGHMK